MLKEMNEQPKTIRDTISPRIKDGRIVIDELGMSDEEIRNISRIHIVACGSAYHTGFTSKYIFEGMARIPVDVDVASEFRYRNPIFRGWSPCHYYQSVRRDSRFPGGTPYGKKSVALRPLVL